MALVLGILFFIGYGVYLNADHLPFNLLTDLFKKDPTNYVENLKNNKSDDLINNPNISSGNLSSNQKNTRTQIETTKNQTKTYSNINNQNSEKISNQQTKSSIGDNAGESSVPSAPNNGDVAGNDSSIPVQSDEDIMNTSIN